MSVTIADVKPGQRFRYRKHWNVMLSNTIGNFRQALTLAPTREVLHWDNDTPVELSDQN